MSPTFCSLIERIMLDCHIAIASQFHSKKEPWILFLASDWAGVPKYFLLFVCFIFSSLSRQLGCLCCKQNILHLKHFVDGTFLSNIKAVFRDHNNKTNLFYIYCNVEKFWCFNLHFYCLTTKRVEIFSCFLASDWLVVWNLWFLLVDLKTKS